MSDQSNFKPVKIPKNYKYTESWCNRNIGETYDFVPYNLDRICKVKDAHHNITFFLYNVGADIYNHIKALNIQMEQLIDRGWDTLHADKIDSLIYRLGGYSGSTLRDDLELEIQTLLRVNNHDKAPEIVRLALDDVFDMAMRGKRAYEEVKAFLEQLHEAKVQQNIAKLDEQKNLFVPDPSVIELAHVKVENGFVYMLSNPLMPGIFKIGFTGRNPDMRAAEISAQNKSLPPFVVDKYWRTKDPYIVEQRIHSDLESFRRPGEFFGGDPDHFSSVVEKHLIQPE